MLQLLRKTVESKELERTKEHCIRVSELATILGKRYLDNDNLNNLTSAAVLHDIGKKGVPQRILNKPGKLTQHEMEEMKLHVIYSSMYAIEQGFNSEIIRNIYFHHEDFCGITGYPTGLAGEDIPLGARIIRLCDYYDALTNDRPYRKKMSKVEAIKVMVNDKEKFDPQMLSLLIREINNI